MLFMLNQKITSGILRVTPFRHPWLRKSIYTPTYLPSGGEETFGVNIGVITLSVLVPRSSELLSYQWIGTKDRDVVRFSNQGGWANRIPLYSSPFMLFYEPPLPLKFRGGWSHTWASQLIFSGLVASKYIDVVVSILASAALYIVHTCYTYNIVFCIGGQSAVKAAFIQEPIAVRVVN